MNRLDKLSRFHDLRKEFPVFTYDSCNYYLSGNSLELSFAFNLSDKYFFNPVIRIPYKSRLYLPFESLTAQSLDNLVFHIGMIELTSYWKAACPPIVIIKPHSLNSSQVEFWKKIYFNGLGEFFFMNSIEVNEDNFMELAFPQENPVADFSLNQGDGCLVPDGGGKDSAVTMDLLNKSGEDWLPFVINPGVTSREVIMAAGKNEDQTVDFHREIHPQLLKLNNEGFLNGHTPFSALLAFYSLLAAFLTGRHDILLSNESSANEVTVPGTNINHQYSKSVEFEKDFREYYRINISPGFNYFSFLRPMSELRIARLFSDMPDFFHHFRSCNVGSKTGRWCGSCPKCLFTFIILSPFLKPETLISIFGHNLLVDPSLEKTLEELCGIAAVKPFECIGTVDEVNVALNEAFKMYENDDLPYLLNKFKTEGKLKNISGEDFLARLNRLEQGHYLPDRYLNLLRKVLR